VYSTCLFCNNALGANEVVEAFPVGRRLAFDQSRGRLWVVCRKCEKWNLSPLEERWEAIETCERFFHDSRKRVSTDNVGLARLDEGLELVRIGEPKRPEFAAWRYGDQFGRRRRRSMMLGVVGAGTFTVVVGASVTGAVLGIAGAMTMLNLVHALTNLGTLGQGAYRKRRTLARFPHPDGSQLAVRGRDADAMRMVVCDSGWGLELTVSQRGAEEKRLFTGDDARRATALLIPHLTHRGGNRAETLRAVTRIEEQGSPEQFLNWLARNPPHRLYRSRWRGTPEQMRERDSSLNVQGLELCLAVEMAVNEENERHALEDELTLLEQAWKDAEEIAAIADRLTLPVGVDEQLAELKKN
jgi:hypothetical protein